MYSKWTTSEEHAEGKTKFLGGARNITSVDGQVTVILLRTIRGDVDAKSQLTYRRTVKITKEETKLFAIYFRQLKSVYILVFSFS